MRAVRDLTYRSVKGNHHVHLDDAPAVAAAIRDWLSAKFVRDAGAVKRAKL